MAKVVFSSRFEGNLPRPMRALSPMPALSDEAINRPSRAAMRWLRSLPEDVQPLHLMRCDARLCNLLCHRWSDPALALRFVNDLVFGSISGLPRFDEPVRRELRALAAHLAWRVREAPTH
jgi:hypothetical protein